MERLSGLELVAEVAALKAIVLTLMQMVESVHENQNGFKLKLLNEGLTMLARSTTWNAPVNPTDEIKYRARSRCQQIIESL